MKSLACAYCTSDLVKRSQQQGLLGAILNSIRCAQFRCQLCTQRFWIMDWKKQHQNGTTISDKREYQRLKVKYQGTFTTGQRNGEGTIFNLSINGCTIYSPVRLHLGDLVSLRLSIPNSLSSIEIEAGVVRWNFMKRIGIEFSEVDSSQKERLRKLVETLLTYPMNELSAQRRIS
jgi:PilZ domain